MLWLDVDVIGYPPDVVARLIGSGGDIVRGGPDLVRLDAVGATMLLIRADLHREGLVFPTYLYGRRSPFLRDPHPWTYRGVGEIETEGFGLVAKDMGYECWGMPNLEIVHRDR